MTVQSLTVGMPPSPDLPCTLPARAIEEKNQLTSPRTRSWSATVRDWVIDAPTFDL